MYIYLYIYRYGRATTYVAVLQISDVLPVERLDLYSETPSIHTGIRFQGNCFFLLTRVAAPSPRASLGRRTVCGRTEQRRPPVLKRYETKVRMVWGSFLIAAAALKASARNGWPTALFMSLCCNQISEVLQLERLELYSETPSFAVRLATRDGKRHQYEFAGGLQRGAFLSGVERLKG